MLYAINASTRFSRFALGLASFALAFAACGSLAAQEWAQSRGDAGHSGYVAFDPPGKPTFAFSARMGDAVLSPPLIAGWQLFAASLSGKIAAFELPSGRALWSLSLSSSIEGGMAYADGFLYAGDSSGSLAAIDAPTGKIAARAELGAKIGGVSVLPGIGVSAGDYEGNIRLFSAPSLKPLWTSRAESFVNGAASLATGGTTDGGIVAVASCDARLYLFRAKNGSLVSSVEMGSYLPQPPPAMAGRVFALSYEGRAALVDAASGKALWSRDLGNSTRGFLLAPALSPAGAFFASKDGWLRGLSLARGATIFETRSGSEAAASPVVAGSLVLLPDASGMLRAHSTKDGSLIWSLDLGSIPASQASAASAGLAIGMGDGRVLFYSWPK